MACAKRMFQGVMRANFRQRFVDWRDMYFRCRAARIEVAVKLGRVFYTQRALRATRDLLARHRAAAAIQANFRASRAQRAVRMLLRQVRAAKNIQRVFRGFLGREEAALLRLYHRSATTIQCCIRMWLGGIHAERQRVSIMMERAADKDYDFIAAAFEQGKGWRLDVEGNNALMHAAQGGSKRIVKLCLRNNMDPNGRNYQGYTALQLLVTKKPSYPSQVPLGEYMVAHGCNPELPDPEGNTSIILAAMVGRPDLIEMLVKAGVEIEARDNLGMTALHKSAGLGFTSCVATLIKLKADVNCRDSSGAAPLHDAAARDFMAVAQWLIGSGADVNAQDSDGFTPLAFAVTNRNLNIIPLLLESGAEASLGDHNGRTPLHLATGMDDEALVKAICNGDGELDMGDADGDTALHEAAARGLHNVMKVLLAHGANPDVPNTNGGDTAAHIVAEKGYLPLMETLIEYDANMNARNYDGQNVLGVARMHNQREIVNLITTKFATERREDEVLKERLEVVGEDLRLAIGTGGDRWTAHHDVNKDVPFWRNERTGAVSWEDPLSVKRKVLMRRQEKQTGAGDISVVDYKKMWEETHSEIDEYRKRHRAALAIQRVYRGQQVRRSLARVVREAAASTDIQRIMRGWMQRRLFKRLVRHTKAAVKLQDWWRRKQGQRLGWYMMENLRQQRAEKWGAYHINRWMRGWIVRKRNRVRRWRAEGPTRDSAWVELKNGSKVLRKFNVWVEYVAKGTLDIVFYWNRYTGSFQWNKPPEWQHHDTTFKRQQVEMSEKGYTTEMWEAASYLAARFKGKMDRRRVAVMQDAARFFHEAEDKYLKDPLPLPNKCNYMVYLLTSPPHNVDRARPIFMSVVDYMTTRGPDNAFVLYAFAMFLAYTGEEDFDTIELLLERARAADKTGNAFTKVEVGFYRQALVENPHDSLACYNYALCCHYLHKDFEEAEKFYLKSMRLNPHDKRVQANFNYMLEVYVGAEYTAFDAYRAALEKEATAEYKYTTEVDEYKQHLASTAIKRVWRGHKIRAVMRFALRAQAEAEEWFQPCADGAGGLYYYNMQTGDTLWEVPSLKQRVRQLVDYGVLGDEVGVLTSHNELRDSYGDKGTEELTAWEVCYDANQVRYFHNVESGASAWERPKFKLAPLLALLGKHKNQHQDPLNVDAISAAVSTLTSPDFSRPTTRQGGSRPGTRGGMSIISRPTTRATSRPGTATTGVTRATGGEALGEMEQVEVNGVLWEQTLDDEGNKCKWLCEGVCVGRLYEVCC